MQELRGTGVTIPLSRRLLSPPEEFTPEEQSRDSG